MALRALEEWKRKWTADSRSRVVQIRTLTKERHSQTAFGAHERIERVGGTNAHRENREVLQPLHSSFAEIFLVSLRHLALVTTESGRTSGGSDQKVPTYRHILPDAKKCRKLCLGRKWLVTTRKAHDAITAAATVAVAAAHFFP